MNGDQRPAAAGHALRVERVIDAPAEAIFDAFVAMYDSLDELASRVPA